MSYTEGDGHRLEQVRALCRQARLHAEAGEFVQCGQVLGRALHCVLWHMGDASEGEEAQRLYDSTLADAIAEQSERVR